MRQSRLRENIGLTDFMLSVLSNCIFSLEKVRGRTASKDDQDSGQARESGCKHSPLWTWFQRIFSR